MAAGITAIGRSNFQIVIIIDVAGTAGHASVAVGEQETGRTVIEFCSRPAIEGVAGLASSWKVSRGVIGVDRFLIVGEMARSAGGG